MQDAAEAAIAHSSQGRCRGLDSHRVGRGGSNVGTEACCGTLGTMQLVSPWGSARWIDERMHPQCVGIPLFLFGMTPNTFSHFRQSS